MKIEINTLNNEYELILNYNNRIETCYIKDMRRLLEYVLLHMLYCLTGKSEYFSRNYAKIKIEYEKEE